MKSEIKKMLNSVVGEKKQKEILSNMFPKPITNYKKGKLLTVGELKKLPSNSVIFLWYVDEHEVLRKNGFESIHEYDGSDEICTIGGYAIPINGHVDNELISYFDNCGWTFSVYQAIEV
jgi:hypothetical protein